ncbi:hypothetical protein EJ357_44645 [Streptomyces cyaneochromogenes]|uniref:DNA-binding protein n=1 Tax=Streptomyces cyaneochromogenes TaxID=2496836 RepID=A0A3Q9EVH5_9ACTN|nr:hypothetical protein [Streptomyces cyaneochromogenes]AZQ39653.1 hypothetical protein EJ357_44645 [Streptomyces cyaneochromogenes]
MESLSVAEAARRLSISDVAAYEAMRAGRLVRESGSNPARVSLASVQRMAAQRRAEAARRHPDAEGFAQGLDNLLNGPTGNASGYLPVDYARPPRGRNALRLLPADAFALFGRDVLEAAASRNQLRRDGVCATCWAATSARVHETHGPEDTPAYRALLGEPCPADRARWTTEAEATRRAMAALRQTETASRQAAERDRARQEFSAAEAAVRAAVSRRTAAARAYSALDPSVARQAGVQARRRAGFTASGDLPCGCSRDTYCAGHTALFGTSDRRAARR